MRSIRLDPRPTGHPPARCGRPRAGGRPRLALAVVATPLLLFEIDPLDPLTFLGMSLVLGIAALLPAYVPARRASRVNPIAARWID